MWYCQYNHQRAAFGPPAVYAALTYSLRKESSNLNVYNTSYQTPKLHSWQPLSFFFKISTISLEHIHTFPILLQIRARNLSVFSHCSEINDAMSELTIIEYVWGFSWCNMENLFLVRWWLFRKICLSVAFLCRATGRALSALLYKRTELWFKYLH